MNHSSAQDSEVDQRQSRTGFSVTVIEAKPGVDVKIGLSSGSLFSPCVVGRGKDAQFRIDDASVSRNHVRISPLEGRFLIENLSKNGSTFVDGEEIPFGGRSVMESDTGWLQLGRVLLRIDQLTATEPVSQAMSLPTPGRRNSALIVVRDGPDAEVWFNGTPVSLFPQAAKMLRALARRPTETLTYDEIGSESDPTGYLDAGGTNQAQLATYIRNAFIQACEDKHLDASAFGFRTEDHREIARKLIRNVRGIGYALDTRSAVVIERDDPPPRKE